MSAAEPLVSIGIPTYNRADRLERAVRSALGQSHANLEVLVSDNGSTDHTSLVVEKLTAADHRVRSLRSEINRGPTANFNLVREKATGEYFMWLGDDDWIDSDYVSSCLEALVADPRVTLATGKVRYYRDGTEPWDGLRVEPVADDAVRRVVDFYHVVRDNGTFYGLSPQDVHRQIPPMENAMGNDVQHVAALAFLGPFCTLDGTSVHRDTGGATASLKRAARSAGITWWQGEFTPLAMAWLALRDIGWCSSVYAPLGRSRRLGLGLRCASIFIRRFVPQAVPKYLRLMRGRVASVFRGLAQVVNRFQTQT